jgi:hypothetical protein
MLLKVDRVGVPRHGQRSRRRVSVGIRFALFAVVACAVAAVGSGGGGVVVVVASFAAALRL